MKQLTLLIFLFVCTATFGQEKESPCILEGDIYVVVEDMPEFPGGPEALYKYLGEHINYPERAREGLIQGKVFVKFTVSSSGAICQVRVVRGVAPALDQEAVRVIKSLPNWLPGKQRGVAVNVEYTLPINFDLGIEARGPIWLSEEGNECEKENAAYYRKTVLLEQGGVLVREYYMNGTLRMQGVYAEESLITRLGDFKYYHAGGTLASEVSYELGLEIEGSRKIYDEQGREKEAAFVVVENMPEFPGGEAAMYKWLAKEIKTPKDADQTSLSGRVIVQFEISPEGKVENARTMNPVEEALAKEALRVVNAMPDWKPGTQKGEAVRVLYTLPIQLVLQSR